MSDQIRLAALHRIESTNPQKLERHSFDFIVNGVSLFEATRAAEYDMCGSLSNPQFEREIARRVNGETAALLTSDVPTGGHRVALFVCPECGDVACGAITARVSRTDGGVQWSDFAYENGFDPASTLDLGPFQFDWAAYLNEMGRAKAD
ncbi:hypothetical protein [Bradyrhizobium sp. Y36]|uniref:hypothetical protein n=1 Tax=Bradyrhizobium sp. Y36 TaxID=2035447 RepID=UPI0011787AC2|nr:hypothetical protein [Bradyrhizobium sp. Y36]